MAPRAGVGPRMRQRKLSTRIGLQVIREKDLLENLESDQPASAKVETGVEKHEETEHHLQAAIASQAAGVGGKAAQVYIPTPETVSSSLPYKQLYQASFSQPATLIRFSSTVEDCCGCLYNLTEDDDVFLKQLNEKLAQKRGGPGPCSGDQMEMVMSYFEETARTQQPFSNVGDPPPILTFEEMQSFYDENLDEPARLFAKDIYEHWKSLRSQNDNSSVQPGLKLKIMESAADGDDNDPFVCFRRREVRQVRKTRGRDAQSVEKLKKLRIELEAARNLVQLVKARELAKKDHLAAERKMFEERNELRQLKRALPDPYKDGDEDLLVNQKPPKRRPMVEVSSQRALLSQQKPTTQRSDGKPAEQDLVQVEDIRQRRDTDIAKEIALKKIQHQKWNVEHVDWTNAPLTPPPTATENRGFRYAMAAHQLPTPPASHSDEEHQEDAMQIDEKPDGIRYANVGFHGPLPNRTSFRRRIGRGGRMMIDRRGPGVRRREDLDPRVAEMFKYDDNDDDDEDAHHYWADPWDLNNMRYRAAVAHNTGAHTMSKPARVPIESASTNGTESRPQAAAGGQPVPPTSG